MPSAPTQDTIDQIEPYLTAQSVPPSLTAAVFQALDAAGWTVVAKSDGTPVVTTDTAPMERVAVAGSPGAFLCGVQVGAAGWFTWMEFVAPGGEITRSAPVFIAGDRGLLD
ncbi:MAG: hypothetical protein IT437_04085 [Phycisphaerales bacterium]|nr:hypothetical protein [Phycisphaerales bacterium]